MGKQHYLKLAALEIKDQIELNYGNWTGNPRAGGFMMGGHTVGQLP